MVCAQKTVLFGLFWLLSSLGVGLPEFRLLLDYGKKICVMPATHAPENGTSHLVPETCTCASQSGTSFFSGTGFLHGIEHSFFPSLKLCST